MVIGVPKEIKQNEYRVSVVPAGVRAFTGAGHRVVVQKGAGAGSSITDAEYERAGAGIVDTPEEVWGAADLVIKVKEPVASEFVYFREGLVIFTFFHLAANRELARELIRTGVTAVAYETVETDRHTLPVLAPMSEVAGRLSVQAGAHFLMKAYGGRGVLLGGVPGVTRGSVAIIGAGTVGLNAAKIAAGLGASVTLLDTNLERFRYLDDIFGAAVSTLASNEHNIEEAIRGAELLVGAAHVPGASAPKLVTKEMLSLMKKGSVIVDVAVDQGGCVETIRPTTHAEPTYEVEGIVHYGVTNMPGAVPHTSTFALTNATLPYALKLASLTLEDAAATDTSLKRGINIHGGRVVHHSVAESISVEYTPLEDLLS